MASEGSNLEFSSKIFRSILKFLGCYPDAGGHFKMLNLSAFIGYLTYCVYLGLYATIYEWPDLPKVAMSGAPLLAMIGALFKFVNYTTKRKLFVTLFNRIKWDFWSSTPITKPKEKVVLNGYCEKSLQYNIYQTSVMIVGGCLIAARPFIRMYVLREGNPLKAEGRSLLFRCWVPFGIDIYEDPLYQIILAAQCIGLIVTVLIISAMDSILVFLVLNTCAQFKILCIRFNSFDGASHKNSEIYLKSCVKQHQKLNKLCEELENCLSWLLFGEFLSVCPYLCLCGFLVSTYPGNYYNIFENTSGLIAALLQLFLYCHAAQELTTQSTNIGNAVYASNWTGSSPKIRRLLFLVILRSQKPNYLTAKKFLPVTIISFQMVTRAAMSFFAVLNTINS